MSFTHYFEVRSICFVFASFVRFFRVGILEVEISIAFVDVSGALS